MKKILLILLLLSACSKNKDATSSTNLVDITYEIQTTVTGFDQLRYMEHQSFSIGSAMVDWSISSAGTFTKTAKVPKGTLAQISAIHPNSNSWKIIIRSANGTILSESTSISYHTGPPSYYYKTIGVAAQ